MTEQRQYGDFKKIWTDGRDTGRNEFRDALRALMRGETVDGWQAQDMIREITDWHDKGRPRAGEDTTTKQMLENSVKRAALRKAGVYTGTECADCGGAIDIEDGQSCAGFYQYDCAEYGCYSNMECENCGCADDDRDKAAADIENSPCPHHKDEGCGDGAIDALDINYIVKRDGGLRGVVLVLGTGGPHIELVAKYGVSIMARGWWGSDRVEWFGTERGDDIVDYFDEVKPFSKS